MVTKDQLIDEVWDGRPQTDDVITRCISALRKALGDSAREPVYIETVQRRGYRTMLPVADTAEAPVSPPPSASPIRADLLMIATGFVAVIIIGYIALVGPIVEPPQGFTAGIGGCLPIRMPAGSGGQPTVTCVFGFAEEVISSLKQVEGCR